MMLSTENSIIIVILYLAFVMFTIGCAELIRFFKLKRFIRICRAELHEKKLIPLNKLLLLTRFYKLNHKEVEHILNSFLLIEYQALELNDKQQEALYELLCQYQRQAKFSALPDSIARELSVLFEIDNVPVSIIYKIGDVINDLYNSQVKAARRNQILTWLSVILGVISIAPIILDFLNK
ncbi:hypothetical protein [Exercitatus varius]|uniref:hypothetical protein n=1 Tax=Exercitatus varius TaxID=67857 RepID=UPI00294AE413|nr:hypothetical protein [Exercitatus varius]MDG2961726.1 hypothetical protein [Exercitatus varius]